jgi:hypothetical protein
VNSECNYFNDMARKVKKLFLTVGK